jgi:hypothetical protein
MIRWASKAIGPDRNNRPKMLGSQAFSYDSYRGLSVGSEAA